MSGAQVRHGVLAQGRLPSSRRFREGAATATEIARRGCTDPDQVKDAIAHGSASVSHPVRWQAFRPDNEPSSAPNWATLEFHRYYGPRPRPLLYISGRDDAIDPGVRRMSALKALVGATV